MGYQRGGGERRSLNLKLRPSFARAWTRARGDRSAGRGDQLPAGADVGGVYPAVCMRRRH